MRGIVSGLIVTGLVLPGASSIVPTGLGATPPATPTTPTHLKLELKKVELQGSIDGEYKIALLNSPVTLDVITGTVTGSAKFGSGTANQQPWHGIRVTLASTATYSGVNPCTNNAVTDATLTLPNPTDQGVILQYQEPHPVRGLPTGALPAQNFTLGSSPINVRVVAPVSDGIVCASESPPLRTIAGSSTRLNVPFSLYFDSAKQQIAIANASGNRITTFKLKDSGDVSPLRSIEGGSTLLKGPVGVALDSANDEIFVSNTGNNGILVFNRTDDGDQPPKRTLAGGSTLLAGPGALYADATQTGTQNPDGVLAVANGNGNSITFYDRKDSGNTAPFRVIEGPQTGLSTPCGMAHDTDTHEIFVTNSANNSITVYNDYDGGTTADAANVPPKRFIAGVRTGLSTPCGIRVDTVNQQIAVANDGGNSITFYDVGASGDQYPARSLSGNATGLSGPSDLAVDNADGELIVTDNKNSSVTFHKLNDATPFLAQAPILINSAWEQSLYASYTFSGSLDRVKGTPMIDQSTGYMALPRFDGYRIVWKITSDKLRQPGDANSAILIPPTNEAFTLSNGNVASNLTLGCNNFTPFTVLQLSTNCPPSPMIVAPFPPREGSYHVAATLFGKTQNPALTLHTTRLSLDEVPRLEPTVTLGTNGSIQAINWGFYVAGPSGSGPVQVPAPFPIITSQQMQINLSQSYSQVSPCYTQVTGNTPTLGYSSPTMNGDANSLTDIKNNRCDIFLNDVAKFTFVVTDAYGEQFIFTWSPV